MTKNTTLHVQSGEIGSKLRSCASCSRWGVLFYRQLLISDNRANFQKNPIRSTLFSKRARSGCEASVGMFCCWWAIAHPLR